MAAPDTHSTALSLSKTFPLGEYQALALKGPDRLLENAYYISFTGDFGFRRDYGLPCREVILDHARSAKKLLSNFDLNILNFEFLLPGIDGHRSQRMNELEHFFKASEKMDSIPAAEKYSLAQGSARWYFYVEDLMLEVIRQSNFHAVAVANNHALDYGPSGVDYNIRRLEEKAVPCFGTREKSYLAFEFGAKKGVVYAMTDLLDEPDDQAVIMKLTSDGLAAARQAVNTVDLAIAFVHLIADKSVYPSLYELEQVERLAEAGFQLIVCTGSHWPKGFSHVKGVPVIFGIGNYLFSYARGWSESIGMHFVTGIRDGKIVQLFAVPFDNRFQTGAAAPLKGERLVEFQKTFCDRSEFNATKFFHDRRAASELKQRVARTSLAAYLKSGRRQIIQDVIVLVVYCKILISGRLFFFAGILFIIVAAGLLLWLY